MPPFISDCRLTNLSSLKVSPSFPAREYVTAAFPDSFRDASVILNAYVRQYGYKFAYQYSSFTCHWEFVFGLDCRTLLAQVSLLVAGAKVYIVTFVGTVVTRMFRTLRIHMFLWGVLMSIPQARCVSAGDQDTYRVRRQAETKSVMFPVLLT